MKLSKQLLLSLFFLLTTHLTFSQSVTWQLHHGQGEGIFVPGPNDPPVDEILNELTGGRQPVHGDPGGFQYALIPAMNDAGWEAAPIAEDGDLCWRLDRSALNTSFTVLDFTYFQTSIFITDASESFLLRFYQVDDGARAYVFNSAHPNGEYIGGGDARLYAAIAETDVSPLFVEGEENRIVIVQFDDSQTENFLKVEVIREAELNSCERDIESPEIFITLEDGLEILLSELTFDIPFECGAEPSINFDDIIVRDNCDSNASIVEVTGGIESINEDGSVIFSVNYTAIDESGNRTTSSYFYTILLDQEGPEIRSNLDNNPIFTLDLCNEFSLTLEDLGISATDNCTPEESISLMLSNTEFEGAGDAEVTVLAIDEIGNESTLDIKVRFETNPDFVSIVAGDDVINKTAASDGSITLTEEELLSNDTASDGSELEIQDLALLNPEDGTLVNNNDRTYTFTPSEDFDGALQLTYLVKSRNAALYFQETGHFYEYVPFGTSWDIAKSAAELRKINGLQGYLATITSQAENDFIFERLQGNGWIGASDVEVEGEWRWITGPESREDNGKGLLFWLGERANGMAVDGVYSNWGISKFSGAEPNNLGNNEHYAHFIFDLFRFFDESEAGKWNDFSRTNPSIDGYIVEYGDNDGCASKFVDEAMVNVTIIINNPGFHNSLNRNQRIASKNIELALQPNPLRKQTKLKVELVQANDIHITIRSMNGKIVKALNYDVIEMGENSFDLNFEGLEEGVYFISVKTATTEKTTRAVVLD